MQSSSLVRLRPLALVAALAASACGGGGGTHTLPAATATAAATAAPLGSAQMALTIPNRITPSSERRAQYVSSSTASVVVVANPGSFSTTANVSGSTCVPNPAATAQVCTFTVKAPIGADTFSMTAYSGPNGTGNALSAASSFNATIAEGQNNTVLPVIMGGIPSSLTVTYADGTTTAIVQGVTSKPLTITVYDASGNIIVAPGAFVNSAGVATPIAFTSSLATAHVGYTYTPAATGVTGAIGTTVSLAEPDDTVAFASDGTGYVGASDTLGHAGVQNHTGGGYTTLFKLGWITTPAFTPKIISPLTAAQIIAVGHQGVLIADQTSHVGFVGDVSGSCSLERSDLSGPISAIGGIATDGASDPYLYLNVMDPSLIGSQAFDSLLISHVIGNNCALSNQAVPESYLTASGVAAANGTLFGAGTIGDYMFSAALPEPATVSSNLMDSGLDFQTAAIAAAPDGSHAIVQFSDKKKVDLVGGNGSDSASENLAALPDPYPYGLTLDGAGDIYASNTTSATFGSSGGVSEFNATLTALLGQVQLNSPASTAGPNGQIQNMTVGTYGGSPALFVACSDGIEVTALPLTMSSTPFTTITPAAAAFSAVENGDGRVWLVLSNGELEALPPY